MSEQRESEKGLMVVLRSIRPQEYLLLKGQFLLGAYVRREITFGASNLQEWSYRCCTGAATTMIIDALVGVGPTLRWFQALSLWDSLPFFVCLRTATPLWGERRCALCLGVMDWHNYGTVLGMLECCLRLVWTLEPHFVHYSW